MLRRNIWDHADYQCPIVGTCLTCNDLREVAERVGLDLSAGSGDFDVHTLFVGLCKRPDRPARAVQKLLDRKHRRVLRLFLKARDDEAVWALWREHADRGEIPGALWGVMCNPTVSENMLRRIYGEVHMLSHLLGAAQGADLRRLRALEEESAALAAALAERKTLLRQSIAAWKERHFNLERQLAQERARREAVERERLSLRELVETKALAVLGQERDALREQARELQERLAAAEDMVLRQAGQLEQGVGRTARLEQALAERDREVEALEAALLESLDQVPCSGECGHPETCPCPRLRGKRVLYVGGRSGLKGRYRLLAERFGCELVHHDGGLEQSPHRLQQLLAGADAVVCPVDCVSHEACAAVKKLCKGCLKPVLFARSSGLSSLASSLAELDRVCQ
jgi:hypothetical protein